MYRKMYCDYERTPTLVVSTNTDYEVKLAVAPCGSSEKNCIGWEGVSIFRSVCADRPQEKYRLSKHMLHVQVEVYLVVVSYMYSV